MNEYNRLSPIKPIYFATQIVWYIFTVVEIIIVFRFLLKLIGANTSAQFTQFVYQLSQPLVAPFLSIVPSPTISGSLIEWSSLLAIFAYWVLAWVITRLLLMGRPITTDEANRRLRNQSAE